MRGTIKVKVTKNNDICPNIVYASLYNTKLVHLISTIHSDVLWENKSRRVYSKEEVKHVAIQLKRVNLIGMYNQGM